APWQDHVAFHRVWPWRDLLDTEQSVRGDRTTAFKMGFVRRIRWGRPVAEGSVGISGGPGRAALPTSWTTSRGAPSLTLDERDRLVERRPARTDVRHRNVRVPDRHAAVEDELRRGCHDLRDGRANL